MGLRLLFIAAVFALAAAAQDRAPAIPPGSAVAAAAPRQAATLTDAERIALLLAQRRVLMAELALRDAKDAYHKLTEAVERAVGAKIDEDKLEPLGARH